MEKCLSIMCTLASFRLRVSACIFRILKYNVDDAQVVELVDTLVLGTSAARRKSSSLFLGTIYPKVASFDRAKPEKVAKTSCGDYNQGDHLNK